jgi:hypothetical protein
MPDGLPFPGAFGVPDRPPVYIQLALELDGAVNDFRDNVVV